MTSFILLVIIFGNGDNHEFQSRHRSPANVCR